MKEIKLTKNKVALVDDGDFVRLSEFSWHVTSHGYAATRLRDKKQTYVYMHRIVANASSQLYVDHINGNKLDNRRRNLRECNNSQNLANQRKRTKPCLSRFKGVTLDKEKGKWLVQIQRHKHRVIKRFSSEIAAAEFYNKTATELFGEFALLNKIVGEDRLAIKPEPKTRKLNSNTVREIKNRIASKEQLTSIAKHFGVSISSVSLIKSGKTWAEN